MRQQLQALKTGIVQQPLVREVRGAVARRLATRKAWKTYRQQQQTMIDRAMNFVTIGQIEGDYLEFGVYQGKAMSSAWNAAIRYGQRTMRFHAFDSFSGLPDPSTSGADTGGEFVTGEFACDRVTFERNLRVAGVDLSRVTVTEGFYDATLQTPAGAVGIKAAAVVWIDCDLYSSTVEVLAFLTDVLVDGAVLIFDDWHCFHSRPDRGEQRACAEWLERTPGTVSYHI